MTSIRTWLTQQLTLPDTPLFDKVGERVWPRESFDSSNVPDYPYLVYGMGNATAEDLSEDEGDFDHEPERQFFQVWVHDELTPLGASYLTIDEVIPMVRRALVGKSSTEYHIIRIKYLETSAEFSSEALNTVYRYIRFQAILGKAK